MDLTHMPAGEDWRKEIGRQVENCFLMLVLIGPNWVGLKDEDGKRRLDDPNDAVRYEISSAVRHAVPLIPIRINDAILPTLADLPISMQGLLVRNAMRLRIESEDEDLSAIAGKAAAFKPKPTLPVWTAGLSAAIGLAGGIVATPLVHSFVVSPGASRLSEVTAYDQESRKSVALTENKLREEESTSLKLRSELRTVNERVRAAEQQARDKTSERDTALNSLRELQSELKVSTEKIDELSQLCSGLM